MTRIGPGQDCFIDDVKITNYLLSQSTQKSCSRFKFLVSFGFNPKFPDALRASLIDHFIEHSLVYRKSSSHGEHGNVRGPLLSPDGRNPIVTTCWTKRRGERVWRFTTLLPK